MCLPSLALKKMKIPALKRLNNNTNAYIIGLKKCTARFDLYLFMISSFDK